jgi:hypothetical protein
MFGTALDVAVLVGEEFVQRLLKEKGSKQVANTVSLLHTRC